MIGFAGLSHLGLVSSIAAAAKGFEVMAFDSDGDLVANLEGGRLPVFEPDLDGLLEDSRSRIKFVDDPADLGSCKVLFFSVDVPTDGENQSDLDPLRRLIEQASKAVPPDCVLVVLSQVPPGFTRGLIADKQRLFYQVETLIFGQAVERALHPERFIVGCVNPKTDLPPAYAKFLAAFGCPILPMRYESAELTKISINVCLVASIGAANMMAELCEETEADWSEIVPALKLDRRIGPYAYLVPGLGIGGGNLTRDLMTVKALAGETGTDAGILDAWLVNSRYRRDWALRTIHKTVLSCKDDPVIAVCGLTYKPDTASTKNSPALALVEALRPFQVRAYDPRAKLDATLGQRFFRVASALDACQGADVLAIMTPWPEFGELDVAHLAETMADGVIVDPFGVLDRGVCSDLGLRHFGLGWPIETEEREG